MKKIWTCFEHCIVHHIELMQDRHLDQILMCSIYVICKVAHTDVSFFYFSIFVGHTLDTNLLLSSFLFTGVDVRKFSFLISVSLFVGTGSLRGVLIMLFWFSTVIELFWDDVSKSVSFINELVSKLFDMLKLELLLIKPSFWISAIGSSTPKNLNYAICIAPGKVKTIWKRIGTYVPVTSFFCFFSLSDIFDRVLNFLRRAFNFFFY